MTAPDEKDALMIAGVLWDELTRIKDMTTTTDPEGRTLTLGTAMFFGIMLSVIRDEDARLGMCDAAMGFSYRVNEVLGRIRAAREE